MTLAKVALGWAAENAGVAPETTNRLVVVPAYAAWRTADESYPGIDGHTTSATDFQSDSRRTLGAIIEWLTGLATGADILILSNAAPYGENFGDDFRSALTALGHTYTVTGHTGKFMGYDPLAYDMVCGPHQHGLSSAETYQGTTVSATKYDYLLSHDGRVLSSAGDSEGLPQWLSYGVLINTAHEDHSSLSPVYGPPRWTKQLPFTSNQLGVAGVGGSWDSPYWALVADMQGTLGTCVELTLTTISESVGGVVSGAYCLLHPTQCAVAFWEK